MNTGSLLNPKDERDIAHDQLVSGASPLTTLIIDTTILNFPVDNQRNIGNCVTYNVCEMMSYYWFKKTGKVLKFSERFLQIKTKEIDGRSDTQGTFPRAPMNVACSVGCCTTDSLPNDTTLSYEDYMNVQITPAMIAEAQQYKMPGYVTLTDMSLEGIRQFLLDHKVIGITLGVGDFSKSLFQPPTTQPTEFHRLTQYGNIADVNLDKNSWGIEWGNAGYGSHLYSQFTKYIYDIMAFADVSLIKKQKTMEKPQHTFTTHMKFGDNNPEVFVLQKCLVYIGLLNAVPNGNFGPKTLLAVEQFQTQKGLPSTGLVLDLTIEKLNEMFSVTPISTPTTTLDKFCHAIAQYEGAKPELNNPGDIRYGEFTTSCGATGQDYRGFAIFPDYTTGYEALKKLVTNACSGNSSIYHPTDTIDQFFEKFAPASDSNAPDTYAAWVANNVGISVDSQISSLLS